MIFNNNVTKMKFKSSELHNFNWLYKVAPCFPVNASKINIITDPRDFYDKLCERFQNARRRVTVASLYIGTGPLEKRLLEVTKTNALNNDNLKVKVLLDFQRGTRGEENSKTLLLSYFSDLSDRCKLFLYQTPRLHGSISKILPARYNEIIGLQHMKLYIADDSILLSGANCSNDYFLRRQDRYVEIEDVNLANFYHELIDEVSKISNRNEKHNNWESNFKEISVKEVNNKVNELINRWKESQEHVINNESSTDVDTWIFPLIQMGDFEITQDEEVTSRILASAPKGSFLRLATGYFNLTDKYSNILLKQCQANISLLMAHPNANGFMGAAGPAGGIPHAYSLIARKFWQRVVDTNQASRIRLYEYEREKWTFHAKGLWYYPAGSDVPWGTLVGSANLGERSVRRDLEAQAAIFTTSTELQTKLHKECSSLHEHARECSKELQERHTPLWVQATVGIFRTYF